MANEKGLLINPKAAITSLPEWYKKKRPLRGTSKKYKLENDGQNNATIKRCNPFGDALAAGYFIFLENDVQVTLEDGSHRFTWSRGGEDFISWHSIEQISPELIPVNYDPQPYKFMVNWGVETPLGYSSLFTHPLNRTELPFVTLSGVVETDGYRQPINFPFILKKDFEGIIQAGTPIAQVIPFKREPWKAEILHFDASKTAEIEAPFRRKIFRAYKTLFWKRKEYK